MNKLVLILKNSAWKSTFLGVLFGLALTTNVFGLNRCAVCGSAVAAFHR